MKSTVFVIGILCHIASLSQTLPESNLDLYASNHVASETFKIRKSRIYFAEFTDRMPEFPGGLSSLNQWISDHLELPDNYSPVSGTAYVRLIVEKTGEISSIRILKGLTTIQDQAILTALEKMPMWTPGLMYGKAVKAQYDFPIKFTTK